MTATPVPTTTSSTAVAGAAVLAAEDAALGPLDTEPHGHEYQRAIVDGGGERTVLWRRRRAWRSAEKRLARGFVPVVHDVYGTIERGTSKLAW
jgi:hypothetical protein